MLIILIHSLLCVAKNINRSVFCVYRRLQRLFNDDNYIGTYVIVYVTIYSNICYSICYYI